MRSGTAQAINDVWTSLSVTGWIAHAGDPSEIVESGKRTGEMGKDMVGWGRWDSAPGQTAGSLIPDVVGAVVSGGTLPAARGAGRAASRYARWSALANPIPVDRLASAARVLADSAASRTMADVADLGRWINDRWDGTKEAAARAGQRWQPATALAGGPSPSVAPSRGLDSPGVTQQSVDTSRGSSASPSASPGAGAGSPAGSGSATGGPSPEVSAPGTSPDAPSNPSPAPDVPDSPSSSPDGGAPEGASAPDRADGSAPDADAPRDGANQPDAVSDAPGPSDLSDEPGTSPGRDGESSSAPDGGVDWAERARPMDPARDSGPVVDRHGRDYYIDDDGRRHVLGDPADTYRDVNGRLHDLDSKYATDVNKPEIEGYDRARGHRADMGELSDDVRATEEAAQVARRDALAERDAAFEEGRAIAREAGIDPKILERKAAAARVGDLIDEGLLEEAWRKLQTI